LNEAETPSTIGEQENMGLAAGECANWHSPNEAERHPETV
jgi:hypothetical protein